MAAKRKRRKPAEDPVTAYARAVTKGAVVAGKHQRNACRRHLRDLRRPKRDGLVWRPEVAAMACAFFPRLLRHFKGKWTGQAFHLSPWQVFIVGSIFGWFNDEGLRRFREAYAEIARKNGKSTMAAGIALLLAFFDHEGGAEVYCAATKRDQAKIVFRAAWNMVRASPALRRRLRVLTQNLSHEPSDSKLEPLGADADNLDGLNVHGAIVDELHAHKTRDMVDVLETATSARSQPLVFYITTAGVDRQSVCWQKRQYAEAVAAGTIPDDTFFSFIAAADDKDDWTSVEARQKANPNLGVSVYPKDLERKVEKAKNLPAEQNVFRRRHLNQWTEQIDRWIDLALWDKNAGPRRHAQYAKAGHLADAIVKGRRCWGALDAASTLDLAAFAIVFEPDEKGVYDAAVQLFCPADTVAKRSKKDRVPYDVWVRQGFITATPGNVTDFDFIEAAILKQCELFNVLDVAYDRWNTTQLVTHLVAELGEKRVTPHGQGFASMSAPTRELQRLLLGGKIRHWGHPVLRWMASNVAVRQDPAGNLKPDKDRSSDRIDGIVALIMCLTAAAKAGPPPKPSVYAKRGLLLVE